MTIWCINFFRIEFYFAICVKELLKVADILYKAKRSVAMQNDNEFGQELDISSRKNEIEQIKNLSEDIVNLGINVSYIN